MSFNYGKKESNSETLEIPFYGEHKRCRNRKEMIAFETNLSEESKRVAMNHYISNLNIIDSGLKTLRKVFDMLVNLKEITRFEGIHDPDFD